MRIRVFYCGFVLSVCFGGTFCLSPIPIHALKGEEMGALTGLASLKSSDLLVFSHCLRILSIWGKTKQTYLKIINLVGRKETVE